MVISKGEVTLKDIAKTVGKSVATVSKALHDHEDISPETRAAIKRVAQQLGYRPNIMAQRLQKQQSETLGLIVPTLQARQSDPFFTELLAGMADQAAIEGFDLLVSTRKPEVEEREAYQHLVYQRRVDGVIVAQPRLRDWRITFLKAQTVPFVVVGHLSSGLNVPGVVIDTVKGIQKAVNHLILQGRRKLALIPPPPDLLFAGECRQAFRDAMTRQTGVRGRVAAEVEAFSQKTGYRAAQILFAEADPPDAIVTCHDLVALGAMAAIHDQGFEVGSDVAVIGFGDILLSEYAQPPLTSVHQPTYAMGQRACKMVIDQIQGKLLSPKQVVIEPWLVVRQSSGLDLWL